MRRYVLNECFDLGILVANVSPTSEKYLQKPFAILAINKLNLLELRRLHDYPSYSLYYNL